METNLRTLGPKETKVILSLREKCRDVVQAADLRFGVTYCIYENSNIL